jgi:hypothetical protein
MLSEPAGTGIATDRWRVQTMNAVVALGMLTLASSAKAGQLPPEMWADDTKYGRPSITAGPNGVSITIQSNAIADAGGGAIADLAKQFLERYAPGMCSSVFDFQTAHKGMTVGVAVQSPAYAVPGGNLYVVDGKEISVTFDYTPSRKVTCVSAEPRMS